MAPDPARALVIGVDGCRAGWIAAFLGASGDVRVEVFARFQEVLAERAAVVAVDMPIGLPEQTGIGGRAAENCVRPLLGARQSSVFSVPSRAAIYASDYGEACRLAQATSDPPRKVSKQLYMLVPKIREVDECLRTDPAIARRVFEVHPEVAFWRLNGEQPLSEPKKIKGRPYEPGLALRQEILIKAGLSEQAARAKPPRGSAPDDLLDALACALIARRVLAGAAKPFPDPPPRDEAGLTMAIWA
jgi:predicted RNase H-like nuclease